MPSDFRLQLISDYRCQISAGQESNRPFVGVAREDLRDVLRAQMFRDALGEDVAEIGRDRQVTALPELLALEPRPLAVNLAALDVAAEDEHRVAVAMVRAAVAVLLHRPAELRHRDHDDVRHAIAEVLGERGDARREVVQAVRDLSLRAALVRVVIPIPCFRERDFEAEVAFDDLRDLPERVPVGGRRVLRAVRRRVADRIHLFDHLDRIKGFRAGRAQQRIGGLRVLRLEGRRHHVGRHAGADAKLAELADGKGRRRALERAREVRRERHGAERTGVLVLLRVQIAVQPAIARALQPRRAALHVVLRVEVRPRFVVRPARVNDRQLVALEIRVKRGHARMQAEEAVEIDRAVTLVRLRNRDRRPRAVVRLFAERDDHVEPVDGAALEDRDQDLLARLGCLGRARDELRRESEAHEREAAVLEEYASSHHVKCSCQAQGHRPKAQVLSAPFSAVPVCSSASGLWPSAYSYRL